MKSEEKKTKKEKRGTKRSKNTITTYSSIWFGEYEQLCPWFLDLIELNWFLVCLVWFGLKMVWKKKKKKTK